LVNVLTGGEKVEADKGYRGEPHYVILPSGENDAAQRARSRHETVNKRFKQWGSLHRVFRHHLGKHQAVFFAVATITQLAIENGEPLFDVLEYNNP
jgi:hypothetical protein